METKEVDGLFKNISRCDKCGVVLKLGEGFICDKKTYCKEHMNAWLEGSI